MVSKRIEDKDFDDIVDGAVDNEKTNVEKATIFIKDVLKNNKDLSAEFLKIVEEKLFKSVEEQQKKDILSQFIHEITDTKESVPLIIGNKEKTLSDFLKKEDIFSAFKTACNNLGELGHEDSTDYLDYNLWDGFKINKNDRIKDKYTDNTFKDALLDVTVVLYPKWVRKRALSSLERKDSEV